MHTNVTLNRKDLLKLLDIADTALFELIDEGSQSILTFSHGEIEVMDALRFVDGVFEDRNK